MDEYDAEIERLRKKIEDLDLTKKRQEKLKEIERLENIRKQQEKLKEIEVKKVEEPTLKDTVKELNSLLKGESKSKIKVKELKLLRRAKVGKSKMKRGYSGVLVLNENKTISGQKVKLDGGTYRTKDGNIHVTNGNELLFWGGKYPVLWQRYDKLNPTNLFAKGDEKNEIYGQDMVELRMKRDLIKDKAKGKYGWIMIIAVLVGGYFLIKAFFPKLFGG